MRRVFTPCLILIPFLLINQNSTFLDSIHIQLNLESEENKIESFIVLSEDFRFVEFEKCLILGNEALRLSELIDNKRLKAKSFKSIGVSYYYNGLFDSAYSNYFQAKNIYQGINNEEGIASCFNNIALLYAIWAKYSEALDYHQQAYQIRRKLKKRPDEANSLINIGNVYFYQSDYRKSLKSYFDALAIYKELNINNDIAMTNSNIGVIYKQLNEFDKAIIYLERSEDIFRITGDEKALSRTLLNIADIYNFKIKDYIQAKKYYLESLELKKKSNDNIRIALVHNNLGTMYANMEKYLQASSYFYLAKDLYEEMNDMSGLIMVHHNIGNIHQATEDYTKAIHFYQKSLSKATDYKYIDYISSNQKALFECYAAICNKEKFNEYFQLYSAGVDTIIDRINRAEMLEIESKYRYEEINKQNETLQDQLIIQNGLVNKYRNYSYGLAAITIIVLVIFGLIIIKK